MANDWTASDDGKRLTHAFLNVRTREVARIFVSGIIVGIEDNAWGRFLHLQWNEEAISLSNLLAECILTLKDAIEGSSPESFHKTTEMVYCTPMEAEEEDFVLRVRQTDETQVGMLEYDAVDGFLPAKSDDPPIAIGATVRCAVTLVREQRMAVEYADESTSWAMGWLLDASQIHRCYVKTGRKHRSRAAVWRIESSEDELEDSTPPPSTQRGLKRRGRPIIFVVELYPVANIETAHEARRFRVLRAAMCTVSELLEQATDAGGSVDDQIRSWLTKEPATANRLRVVAYTDQLWICFTSPPLDELFSGLYPYRDSGRLADEMSGYFAAGMADVIAHGRPRDDWEQMLTFKRRAVYEKYPDLR
ncbi:hypothetical protein HMN09_00557300 [Mycena chlorophos]|uniref:Uncharacterized protein n=1 Tax=Mycena chlorophos TaxID=658473 RepID=A0A8H6TAA2_MYCCL|nr:hypothetical protein HMN09_00557300 [Mycena chlorophos]